MRVLIVAFGRLKTPGLREAADYYQKLLRPWAQVQELELKPLEVPDKSPATRAKIQEREHELLRAKLDSLLSPRGKLYLLDEIGKPQPTTRWAGLARSWEEGSVPEVALVIGSSLGFSDALKREAHGLLSLGPQTLSHELARVVLCEQLYRSWSVVRGHPYHNEG